MGGDQFTVGEVIFNLTALKTHTADVAVQVIELLGTENANLRARLATIEQERLERSAQFFEKSANLVWSNDEVADALRLMKFDSQEGQNG